MARTDLLPGVRTDSCPPRVLVDSRTLVLRARRRAAIRDAANLILLGLVNYVAWNWPLTHVPFMDREESVLLLAVVNAVVLTHMLTSRMFARWSARRIATTWCLRERARFFQGGPL